MRSATRAALSLASGLGATETNQLTLSNLDDQPSTYGILTPISFQQINNYVSEGYNPEELYLLYIDKISVPSQMLHEIPDAIAETCGRIYDQYGDLSYSGGTLALYCDYFFHGPPGAPLNVTFHDELDKTKAHYLSSTDTIGIYSYRAFRHGSFNASCFDGGTLHELDAQKVVGNYQSEYVAGESDDSSSRPSVDSVSLFNDPAVVGDPSNPQPRDFRCFRQVLRSLLILGFGPTKSPPSAQYRLPMTSVSQNPRYFADLTQQGLQVALVYDKTSGGHPPDAYSALPGQFGVCKKADDMAIGFSVDGFVRALFWLGDGVPLVSGGPKGKSGKQALRENEPPQGGDREPSPRLAVFQSSTASNALQLPLKQTAPSDCLGAVLQWEQKDQTSAASATVSASPRSLEGTVYFLGQIIRRDYGSPTSYEDDRLVPDPDPVTFLNWAERADGSAERYDEELFRVLRGANPPPHAIAEALGKGPHQSYYVPDLCDARLSIPDAGQNLTCTAEYPNHASAQVLTMLNQIWGLNKSQTSAPVIPTVNLLGP